MITAQEDGQRAQPIAITYAYTDLAGRVVYEVLRRPGKRFSQRRPDLDRPGEFISNLEGVERVPYRWPALFVATERGHAVFVVEGEKDADRLAELNLTATTSAQGAGWEWPQDWAEHFRGAGQVVVIADNDAPGRTAAAQRGAVIRSQVADVRVIESLPEVGDKGDVTDWLDDGHTADELWRLVEATPCLPETKPEPSAVVTDLFKRYSAAELVALPRAFEWLVRGLMTSPTHGMTAGEEKTLKTYVTLFVGLGVAAGKSVFDHFEVDEAKPVMFYVGEGGRVPYTNRLERIAWSMGVELDDLPFFASFETAPILSERFRETLERDLEEVRPGLVILDPLYAFHGAATDARSLHEEGALLSSLSGPCTEAGATLNVVNHWNKTGTGRGLDRITMAGGKEWCDSWWLLSHRSAADVENGRFQLQLDIGSRQWGGRSWDLDIEVGRFDIETGEFNGAISWTIGRHVDSDQEGDDRERVLAVLAERPFELTKEELAKAAGGGLARMRAVVAGLDANAVIEARKVPRVREDGRTFHTWVFGTASGEAMTEGTASGDQTLHDDLSQEEEEAQSAS